MSTTNAFLDPIKLAIKSLFLVICVSAFANLLHANTAQKPLLIRSSGNDLEQLKSYESSLEPEQRIYQGVVDLSSDLGSKILEISLGEKKPGKLVFDLPATILITPHSFYSPDFSQVFLANTKEESEFHEKRVAANAKELREIFEDLQKEGAFEPMTDFGNIFLIASAHNLEKLSTTGFNRWQLEYSKFYAKHKNTIKAGAITTAVVAVAALGYIFRGPLADAPGKATNAIIDYFNSSESNSNNDIEYFETTKNGINIVACEPSLGRTCFSKSHKILEFEFDMSEVKNGSKIRTKKFVEAFSDNGWEQTKADQQHNCKKKAQQQRVKSVNFVPIGGWNDSVSFEVRNSKKAPSAPTSQASAPAPQSEEDSNP